MPPRDDPHVEAQVSSRSKTPYASGPRNGPALTPCKGQNAVFGHLVANPQDGAPQTTTSRRACPEGKLRPHLSLWHRLTKNWNASLTTNWFRRWSGYGVASADTVTAPAMISAGTTPTSGVSYPSPPTPSLTFPTGRNSCAVASTHQSLDDQLPLAPRKSDEYDA